MLRAQIISLSIWVGKHSSKIIRENEDIEALIDVNKAVMEGLALQEKNISAQNEQNQTTATPQDASTYGQNPPASGTSIKG